MRLQHRATFSAVILFLAISNFPNPVLTVHAQTVDASLRRLTVKGDSLLELRQFEAAEDAYKAALKFDADYIQALNGLGRVGYEQMNWKEVKKWFTRTLELDPDNDEAIFHLTNSPGREIQKILRRAADFGKSGDRESAKKTYQQAIDLYEGSFEAYRQLSYIAFGEEEWGRVKDWCKKIIDIRPHDPEANYFLGIAYREAAKDDKHLIRILHHGKSRKYFDAVITKDSTYRDVLYQRALLERWRENWEEAVRFSEQQLAFTPELIHAQVGTYRFYRLLLQNKDKEDVLEFVHNTDSDWSRLFLAEFYRMQEQYSPADSILNGMLHGDIAISRIPVYLALVRLNASREHDDEVNRYYFTALDSIKSDLDAEFLFEDIKYLARDDEIEFFRRLVGPRNKHVFFKKFWTSRNPNPVSPFNVRVVEHYRRLVFAEEEYWSDVILTHSNNPDKFGVIEYPKSYYLNQEFNDKGMVYLRYGEPDETARTLSPGFTPTGTPQFGDFGFQRNESWRYNATSNRPQLIFHFLVDSLGSGNNWRLTPFLPDRSMLEDRLGWDPNLDRLYTSRSQMDYFSLRHEIEAESREDVYSAMVNESHTWEEEIKPLKMSAFVAHFRGPNGKTQMELYLGVKAEDLLRKQEKADAYFEHGAGVFDSNVNERVRYYQNIKLADLNEARIYNDYFIQRYTFELEPDLYHLFFYAKQNEPEKLGGGNFKVEVPEFTDEGLGLSDIQLAYDIGPLKFTSLFNRGEFSIVPNPTSTFSPEQPVHLYYEIYNLAKDSLGLTNYHLEYTLKSVKEKKSGLTKIFSFLGGNKKQSTTIQTENKGSDETANESTSFDVTKFGEGEYLLTLKVQDLNSGEETQKSVKLKLEK